MARLQYVKKEEAPETLREIYEKLGKPRGGEPANIFKLMANSPTTLQAFVQLSAMSEKTLSPSIREAISLLAAEQNGCSYCLAAHSMLAKNIARMSDDEIKNARKALSEEPKVQAILNFTKALLAKQGAVSTDDFADLKANNVSDKEVCEIILAIIVNIFTNYFNKAVETDIDFPPALKL